MPSAFVSKLRKFLKTRRLTSVSQTGTDRIIEFQFSDGQYRLFLEFFASGNVILTDADLKILVLSRNVTQGESQEPQKPGLQDSLESRQNFLGIPDIAETRVQAALNSAIETASAKPPPSSKANSKKGDVLRRSLAISITELPPMLVDHTLQASSFDTTLPLETILEAPALLTVLTQQLQKARELVDSITSSAICKGFIFAKKPNQDTKQASPNTDDKVQHRLLYDDFHPFIPTKFQKNDFIEVLQFEGYNQTVDEFFSSLEGQKLENRLIEREATAQRKLDAAKQDQDNRIKGLQDVQSQNFRKAAAIEANVERVQEAIDSINGLLSQGMDWVNIGKVVEREKKKNNPVANMICLPLNLADNAISLRLSEQDEVESEEEDPFETDNSDSELELIVDAQKEQQQTIVVEVVLTLSPWSNAREYYDQRKTAVVKEAKTQSQAAKAIRSTEQKIKQDLKKAVKHEKALLQPLRHPMWFEKFFWFISSDRYLVVGAKDTSQAEIIYRRYLRTGDVFCHTDARDAAVVVIKNNTDAPDSPIPPATLAQAGQLSVCSSEAWDSKASIGAWWVSANQVSKSTAAGDLLQPGNFNINGDKNFLAPGQLVLGVGIMFKISEESKANHTKHRISEGDLDITTERNTTLGHDDHQLKQDDVQHSVHENEHEDIRDTDDDVRGNALQIEDYSHGIFTHDGDETEKGSLEQRESSRHVERESRQNDGDGNDCDINDPDVTELSSGTIRTSADALRISENKPNSDSAGSKKPKRGQKKKAKKIAVKYRDQDDEDRAAAEAVIGVSVGKKKAEAEEQAKLKREKELEQAKATRRAQHEKKQREAAAYEEKRLTILAGLDAEGEEEIDKYTPIDALIGTPSPGDEILEAVTVCAPWPALGRCKYKVKIQPGAMKKGKAVKELLERWKAESTAKGAIDENSLDTEKVWPRELELIKGIRAEETVNKIPAAKVRLTVVGASAAGNKGGRRSGGGKNQAKG